MKHRKKYIINIYKEIQTYQNKIAFVHKPRRTQTHTDVVVSPHWYYISPPAGSGNDAQLRHPLNYSFSTRGQSFPSLWFLYGFSFSSSCWKNSASVMKHWRGRLSGNRPAKRSPFISVIIQLLTSLQNCTHLQCVAPLISMLKSTEKQECQLTEVNICQAWAALSHRRTRQSEVFPCTTPYSWF